MSDKIIEVSNEQDRRKWNRRREDQALVRERRYQLLQAAAAIHSNSDGMKRAYGCDLWSPHFSIIEAEALLDQIESREKEREKEKE
jgi:hypothetical protein